MAYDLSRLEREFNEVCNKAGVKVTCPIKINGRLKKTLGRVTHTPTADGTYVNSLVEFSKQLLETTTDESVRAVLLHEASHYIATARTGQCCGHNSYFKAVCAEIGTTNDTPKTRVERTVSAEQVYKYTVVCPNCGIIGHYHRMSKNLKNISSCYCKKCNSNNLSVIHNW